MIPTRRVLLLNPPGRQVYIRDYYCSKTSRTNYLFPPIDLLHAGALFQARAWEVLALDAMVLRLTISKALDRIASIRPDVLFTLVGAVAPDEDRAFLELVRSRLPAVQIIGSGDILLEEGARWVHEKVLDAAAQDFASPAIVEYAEGGDTCREGIIFRDGEAVREGPPRRQREAAVGIPPHELFLTLPYRFPFARQRPFASLLTDFGCPFRCRFCVMAGLRYRRRPLSEVGEELKSLHRLHCREFVLFDQTFAADRTRALQFLDLLPADRQAFGWSCFTRPDCIDSELAHVMGRRGCHTVILGVESVHPRTLRAMNKDYTPEQVRDAFALCRAAKLETVATVIVGLPGETVEDIEQTMDFIISIAPDYLSVHTAIPRPATQLRADLVERGILSRDIGRMDQSGAETAISSDQLNAKTVRRLRARFNRRFYLRTGYLLHTGWRVARHPVRLVEHLREATLLILRNR